MPSGSGAELRRHLAGAQREVSKIRSLVCQLCLIYKPHNLIAIHTLRPHLVLAISWGTLAHISLTHSGVGESFRFHATT